MRNSKTVKFLKTIEEESYSNAFEAFLFSFGSSYLLRKNLDRVGRWAKTESDTEKAKNRYRVMIHRLKRDGLIENKKGIILKITQKARTLINQASKKQSSPLDYEKKDGNSVILIVFDVPEKFRGKRVWLRSVIRNMGFEMLQKSVWIGKIKIPKEFIEDLEKMRINEYVEILEIGKMGTIRKI